MKPFNLEAAKRGEPIVSRNCYSVKFIAHVPYARSSDQLVMLHGIQVITHHSDGSFRAGTHELDLFMAPKKRTVWVNLLISGKAFHYDTEESANRMIGSSDQRIGGKAWSLEIEE